jgi:hypothetical protein
MQIKPEEQEIIGNWVLDKGKVVADNQCKRVYELVEIHLTYICAHKSGWDKLYRDPISGRYWEKVYLDSTAHGGGPPSLIFLSNKDAHSKYEIKAE